MPCKRIERNIFLTKPFKRILTSQNDVLANHSNAVFKRLLPNRAMHHYQLKGPTFRYLINLSLPLQLITTTIINGSILFELTSSFCFLLFILLFPRYSNQFYIQRLFLCAPLFIDFVYICMFLCNCSNCTYVYV